MWAAQAFLLYGGEPTLSSQVQMMGLPAQNPRSYLNNSMGFDQRSNAQMYMSTPMPSSGNNCLINRSLQCTPAQNLLQHSQYPISPSMC